jgi:nucleotide-binding universal stress UspA family protein
VALDEICVSGCALAEAMKLAVDQHAALKLVHVVDLHDLYAGAEDIRHALKTEQECCRRGREILEEGRRRAAEAGLQVETALMTAEGQTVADVLVEAGCKWGADLIVTGSHGRRGITRLLLGSVVECLGRVSPMSVLVVGPRHHQDVSTSERG